MSLGVFGGSWKLLGDPFGGSWRGPAEPLGVLGRSLGVLGGPWEALGNPWGVLGSRGSLGRPWGSLGGPWGNLGDPKRGKVALVATRMRFLEGRGDFVFFLTTRPGGSEGVGGEVNLSPG